MPASHFRTLKIRHLPPILVCVCCVVFSPLKSTAKDDGSSVTAPATDWRIWSTHYRALGETEKDALQTKTLRFSGLGRIISTGDCRSPQGKRVASECSQVTLRWQHDELRVQVTGPSTPTTEWLQSGRIYGIMNCQFKASQDWGLGVVTSCEAPNFEDVLVPESIPAARKSAVTTHRKRRRKAPKATVPDWARELRTYRRLKGPHKTSFA